MKVVNNKIVEATENELFDVYLKRGFDEIMSFPDYVAACKSRGTKVKESPKRKSGK